MTNARLVYAVAFSLVTCVNFSFAQDAQQSCISRANYEVLRTKLTETYSEYEKHAHQKLEISASRLELLRSIQQCQRGTNANSDLFDALSLQEPKCNKEIREYNQLLQQEQSISSIMETEITLGKIYSNNLKMYGDICK